MSAGNGRRMIASLRRRIMAEDLVTAIVNFKKDLALATAQSRLGAGDNPLDIIKDCQKGMEIVGERYKNGEYYLSELVLSGQIFKGVLALIRPRLGEARQKDKGTIVIATVKGDLHDIGKDIVANLFESRGFEVFDLGVDVAAEVIVGKMREADAQFVGLSCLLTTSIQSMKETVKAIEEAGRRNSVKILIGGGVTMPETREFVGADFQTRDALEGIEYCLNSKKGMSVDEA
jgi:5-methyltetrahydrofolate--homocysteine methyltransferase